MWAELHRLSARAAAAAAGAVGAVPLDLPALGCDYYTSNMHKASAASSASPAAFVTASAGAGVRCSLSLRRTRSALLRTDPTSAAVPQWLCTPKGAAFLYARRAGGAQARLLPTVTSHGCGLGYQGEFLWAGTADATAIMAAPTGALQLVCICVFMRLCVCLCACKAWRICCRLRCCELSRFYGGSSHWVPYCAAACRCRCLPPSQPLC